eukprot:gene11831-biopygen425
MLQRWTHCRQRTLRCCSPWEGAASVSLAAGCGPCPEGPALKHPGSFQPPRHNGRGVLRRGREEAVAVARGQRYGLQLRLHRQRGCDGGLWLARAGRACLAARHGLPHVQGCAAAARFAEAHAALPAGRRTAAAALAGTRFPPRAAALPGAALRRRDAAPGDVAIYD